MKQAKIYKLSEYCPQAASFWDPALNGDIRFEDVLFRINDYFTFKFKCGRSENDFVCIFGK